MKKYTRAHQVAVPSLASVTMKSENVPAIGICQHDQAGRKPHVKQTASPATTDIGHESKIKSMVAQAPTSRSDKTGSAVSSAREKAKVTSDEKVTVRSETKPCQPCSPRCIKLTENHVTSERMATNVQSSAIPVTSAAPNASFVTGMIQSLKIIDPGEVLNAVGHAHGDVPVHHKTCPSSHMPSGTYLVVSVPRVISNTAVLPDSYTKTQLVTSASRATAPNTVVAVDTQCNVLPNTTNKSTSSLSTPAEKLAIIPGKRGRPRKCTTPGGIATFTKTKKDLKQTCQWHSSKPLTDGKPVVGSVGDKNVNLGPSKSNLECVPSSNTTVSNTIPPLEPVITLIKKEIVRSVSNSSMDNKELPKGTRQQSDTSVSEANHGELVTSCDTTDIEQEKNDQSGRFIDGMIVKGYSIPVELFDSLQDGSIDSRSGNNFQTSHQEISDGRVKVANDSGQMVSGFKVTGRVVPVEAQPCHDHTEASLLEQRLLDEDTSVQVAEDKNVAAADDTSGVLFDDLAVTGTKVDIPKFVSNGLDVTSGEQDSVYEEDMVKGDSYLASEISKLHLSGTHVWPQKEEANTRPIALPLKLAMKQQNKNKVRLQQNMYSTENTVTRLTESDQTWQAIVNAHNFRNSLIQLIDKFKSSQKFSKSEKINHLLREVFQSLGDVMCHLNQLLNEVTSSSLDGSYFNQSGISDHKNTDLDSSPLVTESFDQSINHMVNSTFDALKTPNQSNSMDIDLNTPKTPNRGVGVNDSIRVSENCFDDLQYVTAEFSPAEESMNISRSPAASSPVASSSTPIKHFVNICDFSCEAESSNSYLRSPHIRKHQSKDHTLSLEKKVTFDNSVSEISTSYDHDSPTTSTPKKVFTSKFFKLPKNASPSKRWYGKLSSKLKASPNVLKTIKQKRPTKGKASNAAIANSSNQQDSPMHPCWNFGNADFKTCAKSDLERYRIPKVSSGLNMTDPTESFSDEGVKTPRDQSYIPSTSSSSSTSWVSPPTRGQAKKRKKNAKTQSKAKPKSAKKHAAKKEKTVPSNAPHPLLENKRCSLLFGKANTEVIPPARTRGLKERETCFDILNAVYNHEGSDIVCMEISPEEEPDYYKIVKYPMCLDTIARKLRTHLYDKLEDFVSDFRRVFYNCRLYYTNEYCQERQDCKHTEDFFEKILTDKFPNKNFSEITGIPLHTRSRRHLNKTLNLQQDEVHLPSMLKQLMT